MFTGIIQRMAPVAAVRDHSGGRHLVVQAGWGDEKPGESIAVNGCCLTIAQLDPHHLHFDVVPETLVWTNLGRLGVGDRVHLERAVRAGDRFDGHFVQGHVDGMAELIGRTATEHETRLRLRVPDVLAAYIVSKGSVCLDGVSLTVASLEGNEFEVALIPATIQRTALAEHPVGWPMNFEADILVKTIARSMQHMSQNLA